MAEAMSEAGLASRPLVERVVLRHFSEHGTRRSVEMRPSELVVGGKPWSPRGWEEARRLAADPSSVRRPVWLSEDSAGYGWYRWCVDNDFGLAKLACWREYRLDPSRGLSIESMEQLRLFVAEYGATTPYGRMIDWPSVAHRHDWVAICPHFGGVWMEADFEWYFGWDCASAVVWNFRGVLEVGPRVRSVAEDFV